MKSSIYPFILSGLILSSISATANSLPSELNEKNLKVPVAQKTFEFTHSDAPEELANIKAKNAMVPLAPFTLGLADEVEGLGSLNIPVPKFLYGDPHRDIPFGLNVKVKSLAVPTAPRVWGEAAEVPAI